MNTIKEQRESLLKQMEILQTQCLHEDIGFYYVKHLAGYKDTKYCKDCGKGREKS